MQFEWDNTKSDQNRRQRGFGFDYAALIFDRPTLERIDDRHDYTETRVQAIGQTSEDILFVVYTDRNTIRRIISARKASLEERNLWQSFANP
ncbi:MAG: BrnT family toxin [Beijerinckiaceae bacterium]